MKLKIKMYYNLKYNISCEEPPGFNTVRCVSNSFTYQFTCLWNDLPYFNEKEMILNCLKFNSEMQWASEYKF